MLYITILNPLTGGATPVTPIYMQLFCSAGDDFQFGLPSLKNITQCGSILYGTVPLLTEESDNEIEVIDFKPQMYDCILCDQQLSPQMKDGSTLNINSIKAMSMSHLSKVIYPPFGNLASHISVHDQTTSPIVSFKQLMNMVSPLVSQSFSTPISIALDSVVNISGTPAGGNPVTQYNYLLFILSLFRYWRGSFRVTVWKPKDTTGVSNMKAWMIYQPKIGYIITPFTAPSSWFPIDQASQAITFAPDLSLTPVDIIVPYNSMYQKKWSSLPLAGTTDPYSQVLNLWPDTLANCIIGLSGGDDFCAGYLLPPPNCGVLSS